MNDKQRAEFEMWYKENHTQNVQKLNGEYVHGATERLWQAWQAALESVVVELPDWSEYDTPRQAIDACADRIKDAGVKHNDE